MASANGGNAGIQLKVNPFGYANADDVLARIMGRNGTLKPALDIAGRFLVRRAHESFERQESPDGIPWAPLSPVTIALRDKKGSRATQLKRAGQRFAEREAQRREGPGGLWRTFSGDRALLATGRLFGSITYHAGEMELTVGTNAKFPGGEKSCAAIHQLGGQAGRGLAVTIPARPFLGVTDDDAAQVGEKLQDYLDKAGGTASRRRRDGL